MRATVGCLMLCAMTPCWADWPQFRGANSAGIAGEAEIPTEFGPGQHELWSLSVGAGHSSPCIVGNTIYLTSFDAKQRSLSIVSIDRINGRENWRRPVPVKEMETGHPSFNPASSTTASDGERVVAYFGSFGLICFDRAGDKLWERPMPLTKSYAGNATSPAIFGNAVVLYRGNHVDHFLLAVDKESGEQLWKVDQAEPFSSELACTACPIAVGEKLIVHSARSVQAFELGSGKQIWETKCATTATSTPVLAGDEVIVAAWNKMGEPALRPEFPPFRRLIDEHDANRDGFIQRDELPRLMIFHRPDGAEAPQNGASLRFSATDQNRDGRIDRKEWDTKLRQLDRMRASYDTHGILAIKLDSHGLVPERHVRTLARQAIPEVPSPLFHSGFVYYVKNGGVLTCLDLSTGKQTAKVRTRGRGTHYASPIIADDKLLSTAGNGTISVLSLGPKPKVLAINDMQAPTYATPAVVDGVIYVRTHSKLYAFGRRAP